MKIGIIYNLRAGPSGRQLSPALLEQTAVQAGMQPVMLPFKPRLLAADVSGLADAGVEVVAAAGGDGTINAVASQLAGKEIPLAILPAGSGNGFARQFNLPLDPVKVIRAIPSEMEIIAIDTCTWNEKFFLNVAGIGYSGEVAAEFEQEPGRGILTYIRCSLRLYSSVRPFRLTVKSGGEELHFEKVMMAECMNGRQWGGKFVLSPGSDLTDGVMELVVIEKDNSLRDLSLLTYMRTGYPYPKGMHVLKGSSFRLETDRAVYGHCDGQHLLPEAEFTASLMPGNLKVLVPR